MLEKEIMGKLNILIKFGLLLYFGLVSESFLLFLSPFNATKKLVLQEIWPKKLSHFVCLTKVESARRVFYVICFHLLFV